MTSTNPLGTVARSSLLACGHTCGRSSTPIWPLCHARLQTWPGQGLSLNSCCLCCLCNEIKKKKKEILPGFASPILLCVEEPGRAFITAAILSWNGISTNYIQGRHNLHIRCGVDCHKYERKSAPGKDIGRAVLHLNSPDRPVVQYGKLQWQKAQRCAFLSESIDSSTKISNSKIISRSSVISRGREIVNELEIIYRIWYNSILIKTLFPEF